MIFGRKLKKKTLLNMFRRATIKTSYHQSLELDMNSNISQCC
jgi:hypothetical protein